MNNVNARRNLKLVVSNPVLLGTVSPLGLGNRRHDLCRLVVIPGGRKIAGRDQPQRSKVKPLKNSTARRTIPAPDAGQLRQSEPSLVGQLGEGHSVALKVLVDGHAQSYRHGNSDVNSELRPETTTAEGRAPYSGGMNEIKRLRKAKGLTQEQLAAELGIAKGTFSRMESGKLPLKEWQIRQLADIFGVHPGAILAPMNIETVIESLGEDERAILRRLFAKMNAA